MAIRAAGVAAAVLLLLASTAWVGEVPQDPVPIRRTMVDPSEVPEELREQKEFISMPRVEFEEAVRRAARVNAAAQNPPRLLEARYQATLEGGHLVGTAEWKILNPNSEAGLFRWRPWNLALRPGALLNAQPAIFAELEKKTLTLLLETSAVHTLQFRWSARAEQWPEGLRFDLNVPLAAVAVLELELPPSLELTAKRGPVPEPPAVDPNSPRRWQVAFGGRSELDLLVRPRREPRIPTLLFVRQSATYDLALDGIDCLFDLELESHHGRLNVIQLDQDGDLEPVEVRWQQLQQSIPFEVHSVAGQRRIEVRFPEPLEGRGALRVRCRSGPLRPKSRRVFSSLRIRDSIADRQTLTVRTSPEVVLTDWHFGDFRPAGLQTEKDRAESLTLIQEGLASESGPRFPSAAIATQSAEVTARQEAWWHVGSDHSTLIVRIIWDLKAGRLLRLPVALPSGWEVEDVTSSNPEQLRDWNVSDESLEGMPKGGRTLIVDLKESPRPQSPLALTIWLRSSRQTAQTESKVELPVPQVQPLGVRWLETGLAITLEGASDSNSQRKRLFTATARNLLARAAEPPRGAAQLWGGRIPELYYLYHGQGPGGSLLIEPLPVHLQAEATTELSVEPARRVLTYSVLLRPTSGAASVIECSFSEPPPELHWAVIGGNHVVESRRVAAEQGKERWELRLAHPVNEPILIRGQATLPVTADLAVPLLSITGPTPADGQFLLRLGPGVEIKLDFQGLSPVEPVSPPESGSAAPIWRAFRHKPESIATVRTVVNDSAAPVIESATLISYADAAGVYSVYRCQARDLQGRSQLALQLPPAAELCTLRVDDLTVPVAALSDGKLYVPVRGSTTRYEIAYLQPRDARGSLVEIQAEAPQWEESVQVLHVRRLWYLPSFLAPLSPDGWRRVTETALVSKASPEGEDQSRRDWVLWEDLRADGADAPFFCIRTDVGHYLGIASAVIILLAGLSLRLRRARFLFAVTFLLAGTLGLLWLPDALSPLAAWPLLAAALLAVLWYCKHVARAAEPTASLPRTGSVAAAVLILASCVPLTFGQKAPGEAAPIPENVYILGKPGDAAERQRALVPRKLWARLGELGRDVRAGLPAYALLEADYQGSVTGNLARVEAIFQVQAFRDGPVTVALPLGQARLQGMALLDGAPVLATPAPTADGFLVEVRGKGRHEIRLSLETTLRGRLEDRELRLQVPVVPISRLTLHIPPPARAIQAIGIEGGQWLHVDGPEARLETDLGRIPELVVRWRSEPEESADVRVHEAYLWDLQPQQATLKALLQYEVARGAVSQLRIELPTCVEVKSVEIKAETALESPPRLKRWYLTSSGSQRVLVLELRSPATGGLRVLLELPARVSLATPWLEGLPAEALLRSLQPDRPAFFWLLAQGEVQARIGSARHVELRAPRPVGAARVEGLFGYRLDQLRAGPPVGLHDLRKIADANAETLWPKELASPAGPGLTALYRITPQGSPRLQLALRSPQAQLKAHQDLTLWADLAEVELRARLELNVDAGEVSYLEWRVPAALAVADVADVQGEDLQHWTKEPGPGKDEARIRLWFKRPIQQPTIVELTGWLQPARTRDAATLPLPYLRLLAAQTQTTHLRIQRRGTTDADVKNAQGLRAITRPGSDPWPKEFSASQPGYGGVLHLTQPPAAPAPSTSPPSSTRDAQTAESPAADQQPRIRVFSAEYESRPSGDGHCIHMAAYTLIHEPGVDLTFRLPIDSVLLGAAVDDEAVKLAAHESSYTIPLPAARGWCRVYLRWSTRAEPRGEVRPAWPHLEEVAGYPASWVLHIPAGFTWDTGGLQSATGPNAAAWHELHRAARQRELLRALAAPDVARSPDRATDPWRGHETVPQRGDSFEKQMVRAQEHFYGLLRNAEQHLRAAGASADPRATARLAVLPQENQRQFRDTPWEPLRRQAQETAASGAGRILNQESGVRNQESGVRNQGPDTGQLTPGTPVYFSLDPGSSGDTVTLVTPRALQLQRAVPRSIGLLLLAAAVLVLSRSPRAVRFTTVLWPETLALAGTLTWAMLELRYVGLLLITLGLAARLLLVMRWLVRESPPQPRPAEMTTGSSFRTPGES